MVELHHGKLMDVETHIVGSDEKLWLPPIVQTVAASDVPNGKSGIDELVETIAAHHAYLAEADTLKIQERQRIEIELYDRLRHELIQRLLQEVPASLLDEVIERVIRREIDPQSGVREILDTNRVR
jgi:LAO/AO transport system kinase